MQRLGRHHEPPAPDDPQGEGRPAAEEQNRETRCPVQVLRLAWHHPNQDIDKHAEILTAQEVVNRFYPARRRLVD